MTATEELIQILDKIIDERVEAKLLTLINNDPTPEVLRQDAELSVEEVSQKTSNGKTMVSTATILDFEKGRRSNLSHAKCENTMRRIAKAIGVPFSKYRDACRNVWQKKQKPW